MQQITTTSGGGQASFGYDPAGNTTTRTIDTHTQTLDWDTEGRLGSVTESTGTTEMIYTADGERLVRDDGDTVTVFLPQTEAVWDTNTDDVDVTRYFDHAGQVVAICTGPDVAGWTWMGVDHHGITTTHSVNAFTGVSHIRRLDPYGNQRGPTPQTWPGQQHFVQGVKDPTGLIHIGARTYDPTTGRFITIDPILDVTDDQQINGYTYANANPITYTDPTGFLVCAPDGHNFCPDRVTLVVLHPPVGETLHPQRMRQMHPGARLGQHVSGPVPAVGRLQHHLRLLTPGGDLRR